jgi:iron complex outermembrane receptor protein
MKKNLGRTVAAAVSMVLAIPVTQQACADQADGAGIEEIVVTARKRAESLQDVGSSVSAISAAELERRPDLNLASFSNASPNVIFDDMQEGPGSPVAMTIRGIGTNDHERSIDPTVGVVVDGVFIGTVGGAMVKALDLQSVEILRGPQGTLFGRNSIAGAVNITRRKPDSEFTGEVRASYGNYNDVQVDGYVSLPVNDRLSFKIAGAWNDRDGYYYNRTLNKRQGDEEYKTFSPSVVWRPTDEIEFYYRYDWQKTTQDASVLLNVAQPDQAWCFFYQQCAPNVRQPQGGDRYESLQNTPDSNAWFKSQTHILNAKWDVAPGYRVEYVFGYFATKEDAHWDYDGTPLTLYDTQRPQKWFQRSHELRLTYSGDGPLSYTLGAYAWNSSYRIDMISTIGFGDLLFGLPSGTLLQVPQSVAQATKSYAGFFEGDYKFGDAWTLTLGGRYTHDKKNTGLIDPLFTAQLAVAGGIDNPVSKSWSEFTPKVSLRYRWSPDLMAYALYSRGFRAGGFSGRPGTYEAAVTPYDPERVDNYELGIKSEWLDRRLRLNASVYYMKYKDKQEELSVPINVAGGTGQQTLFLNASSATLKGAELELVAAPGGGFTISASLGLLDAKYKDFNDPLTGQSLTNLKLRRAPDVTATVSPSFEWPALSGKMAIRADWRYVSSYENTFLNSPQSSNGSQNVIDATLNYQYKNTDIAIYGRNLTNDDSYTIGLDVARNLTFPGLWTFVGSRPPRTYGVRITQRF